MQHLYSFGFNVLHFWHIISVDMQASLRGILSFLYPMGLIIWYSGNHMIGVKNVTNNMHMICSVLLFVLADMSLAVRIILIIRKKINIIIKLVDKLSDHEN